MWFFFPKIECCFLKIETFLQPSRQEEKPGGHRVCSNSRSISSLVLWATHHYTLCLQRLWDNVTSVGRLGSWFVVYMARSYPPPPLLLLRQ